MKQSDYEHNIFHTWKIKPCFKIKGEPPRVAVYGVASDGVTEWGLELDPEQIMAAIIGGCL